MQLTDHDIREFTEAWRKDFGEVLSPDQARHEATKIIRLFRSIAHDMIRAHQERHEPPTHDL